MKLLIYVCPTGCGNYYGTSGMPDLSVALTGAKTEDKANISVEESRVGVQGMRHTRAECPDCRQQGKFVERKLIEIDVPAAAL